MKDCSIESRLLFAHNAISNALRNTVIKNALIEYGYDDHMIKSGRTLYEEAFTLHSIQVREYGAQLFITDELIQARAEANIIYRGHLQLARIALRKFTETIDILWQKELTSRSLFGWMNQVDLFYHNLLESSIKIKKVLNKVGLSEYKLKEGLKNLMDVESLLYQQLKKDGEAHRTTKNRDQAFDVMNEWVSDFIEISTIALASKPQYLEIMGVYRK